MYRCGNNNYSIYLNKTLCIFSESSARFTMDKKPPVLRFCKLTKDAKTPTRGSKLSAGYDLYSAQNYTIEPKCKALVMTDIQVSVPEGTYGRIAPKSGLTVKHFIDVGAGVIDPDYRGNVGVVLFNFGKESYTVNKGDEIGQLILECFCLADLQELPLLDKTERGNNGFGSTSERHKTLNL